MNGLEEAKLLYEQRGKDMLHTCFPEYEGRIAVGLAGHGSECFGYDDELSRILMIFTLVRGFPAATESSPAAAQH